MVKHTVILHNGFFFSFKHQKEIDWDNARLIIGCRLIQMVRARWDGHDCEMLVDEEALMYEKPKKKNDKATFAYQSFWTNYQNQEKHRTFLLKPINEYIIYGNAILIKK